VNPTLPLIQFNSQDYDERMNFASMNTSQTHSRMQVQEIKGRIRRLTGLCRFRRIRGGSGG